ncbi:MAG: hypothetical protein AAF328_11605 [Planctomycetota bacterium]
MIVYACADLMFASKVSATCNAAGIVSRPARSAAMLQARLDCVDDGKANGVVTQVFVELTRDDALELISFANTHATRADVRIVAFGPHVDTDRLAAAKEHGADEVLTRGAFAAQVDALVKP